MLKYNIYYEPIFDDENILVVNKAHGIHVIQDRYLAESNILINILREDFSKDILLVHRLDAGTGGVMLFAKNIETQRFLTSQFEKGVVEKEYLAVVEGHIDDQRLSLPIAKANQGRYKVNFTSGKESITNFETLSKNNSYSLLKVIPETGRTHQIRVHLKTLKAPLKYDFLYNKNSDSKLFSLFARTIKFTHPTTKAITTYYAPLSEFMKNIIISLELGNQDMVSLLDENSI